ncbi:MAG: thiamine-phosphate kinase [Cellvibrionaceae bacterium]|nr:thiamine-phosphate kinase [Cellvibrionaceae bacterium]
MNEFELITTYFQRAKVHSETIKSIGDDCAILEVPTGQRLVVSMDTLVAGHHFPDTASPADIARRVFCTCISDLAAMGAQPRWLTLGLTMPAADRQWLSPFSQTLLALCADYGCDLVGGDTTAGPLTITVQVHGVVSAQHCLTRDAAQAGDAVWVTGTLGDGAAALAMLQGECSFAEPHRLYLHERFYCPQPQIAAGLHLVDCAHGAIDISDGLLADLQHIAHASEVDIALDIECLPLSDACRTVGLERSRQWALNGGDDYQLAFTVAPKQSHIVDQLIQQGAIRATLIGRVVTREGASSKVHCYLQGRPYSLLTHQQGYQHFAS